MYRLLAIILLTLFSAPFCFAQFFSAGNDPVKRWRSIKSEHFTVIYPREADSIARRYISLFEYNRPAVLKGLKIDTEPIPIVLHPYTTISNGMVMWAPKRLDLFTTPPAYEGPYSPWDAHLSVHESRHIGQVTHFTKGVWNVLNYILGEAGTGIGVGLYPTMMFMEGDAVITETELTPAGRGREAEFMQYYRTAYLNGDFRNWDRYYLGSYRYYTPNRYNFGYMMCTSVRYLNQDYYWSSKYLKHLVKDWWNLKSIISVPKGKNVGTIFRIEKSRDIMSRIWKMDFEKRGPYYTPEYLHISNERLYCDYRNILPIRNRNTGEITRYIGIKEGMSHPKTLISIDTEGKESVLAPFNDFSSPLKPGSNGQIYWTETVYRSAHSLEDFSELKSFNTVTGKRCRYRRGTRYFNPAPSVTADTIAVAEYPVKGSSFLVFLEPRKGRPFYRKEGPGQGSIKEITFMGKDLYCTAILDRGMGIYRLHDGEWEEVAAQQNQSISGLKSHREYLYFSSDLDGVLNIYRYDTVKKELKRITNSRYGATDPVFDEESGDLYYADYTHKGYRYVRLKSDVLENHEASFSAPYRPAVVNMLLSQSGPETSACYADSLQILDEKEYPSEKYSKLKHLFRFHSWAPFYYNVDNIMDMSFEHFYNLLSLGAVAYSQNTLGTAVTMFGYSYHNGFNSGHFKFTYNGFGTTEASIDFNDRKILVYGEEGRRDTGANGLFKSSVRYYLPVSLFSGGWKKGFIPQISWTYTNDRYFSKEKEDYIYKHQLDYGIRYYQMLPVPTSGIYPRWGFSLSAMGSCAPGSGENFGQLGYLYGYFYLPGIVRNQGLRLSAGYQHQFCEGKRYYLASYASLPRGYSSRLTPTRSYIKGTVDYAIPIYLGDKSLSKLLYFKRLQLIPFFDIARDINKKGKREVFYSYGSDILLDVNVLRISFPISLGMRYARAAENQIGNRNHFSFLFNISIN